MKQISSSYIGVIAYRKGKSSFALGSRYTNYCQVTWISERTFSYSIERDGRKLLSWSTWEIKNGLIDSKSARLAIDYLMCLEEGRTFSRRIYRSSPWLDLGRTSIKKFHCKKFLQEFLVFLLRQSVQ